MQTPVTVTFRDMEGSDFVRQAIETEADRLEKHHDNITNCRVVIAAPNKQTKGSHFSVHLEVSVPGKDVVVTHDAADKHRNEDGYAAIRDAFKNARRQLDDIRGRRTSKRHG